MELEQCDNFSKPSKEPTRTKNIVENQDIQQKSRVEKKSKELEERMSKQMEKKLTRLKKR